MSLFQELKRRNVFRVGIAYAVAAWVILQGVDVVGEILELPDWAGKLILLILVVGLIPALIVAWAFEMTPEGIKREHEVDRSRSITPQTGKKLNNMILAAMALAIAFLLYDKFSPVEKSGQAADSSVVAEQPEQATAIAAEPEINRQSIAVLPFTNRSRLEEDEFFVAGVHDDLLTNLARIGDLKVISRTSVLRYKDTEKPIPEIAKELNVATVMEGAVQRSGNTVRINVQLIDANTDEHLWAEIFDRELTADNLFAIQSEISGEIAKALKTTLSPEEQERISDRPTENLAAYNAYLRGRQLMTRRNSEDLEQAAVEFNRAVELDPEFALAWVGVAETAALLVGYSTLGIPESIQRQEEATQRALALNDQLGEAHLSQAGLHAFHEQWDEAEASFRKAIELSPGYATAYQWYSNYVATYPHRLQEASTLIGKAVDLDPLSSIIRINQINKLTALGQFEESERQMKHLLELDPDFAPTYSAMANLLSITGRFGEQVIWFRKSAEIDPGRIQLNIPLAIAFLDMGDEEAIEDIKRKVEEIDDQHFVIGFVDTLQNLYRKNYPAALESANWVGQQIGQVPQFAGFVGFVHMMAGNNDKALASFKIAEPRFFDRTTWRAAIEQQNSQGCINAWLMMRTGQEEMGRDLLDMTLAYMEHELPGYVDHADRFAYEPCYLAKGDNEKALQALETTVAHGHLSFWWTWMKSPMTEPLRGEPRFEAALQAIEDKTAAQRENLKRLEAEAAL